jgi:hypothetical protein
MAIYEESQHLYFRNYMKRIVYISANIDIPKDNIKQLPQIYSAQIEQKRFLVADWFKIRRYCHH